MPPKKAPAASKKTEQKKKEKVIEDKTFGLKNKKGSKQQKFIQQVQKQVQSGGQHPRTDGDKRKEEKEKKLQEQRELALIFRPVQGQKVEKGTDPKSVVCAFFKQGSCTKGDKCKFSHDLSIEQKTEKRSMYVDMRDDDPDDNMANWDDAKLKEVVDKKHSNEKKRPTTDIICKFFLEAVEKSKYGWFWECPNGEKCIYRHALPPGYVLKKDKRKDDKPSEISLVDLIERERAALGSNQTRVTLETFLAWKKRKIQEKKEKMAAEEEKKKNDFSKGKQFGISGREMFSFNPDLVDDGPMEDGDAAFDNYERSDDEDAVEFRELDLAALSLAAQEADGSGTVASDSRLKEQSEAAAKQSAEDEAAAAAAANDDNSTPANDAAPINKELFMGLGDELEDLDIEDGDDDDDDDDDD